MEMRKFGKTNLETSAVVFGGGFVGGIIYMQMTTLDARPFGWHSTEESTG